MFLYFRSTLITNIVAVCWSRWSRPPELNPNLPQSDNRIGRCTNLAVLALLPGHYLGKTCCNTSLQHHATLLINIRPGFCVYWPNEHSTVGATWNTQPNLIEVKSFDSIKLRQHHTTLYNSYDIVATVRAGLKIHSIVQCCQQYCSSLLHLISHSLGLYLLHQI